jgi:hypothetical protein
VARTLARKAKAAVANTLAFLKVDDPSGGIDLRRSPTLMAANRSRVCRNFTLDEPGALKVYPGWLAWLTTSLGSSRGQGGRRIYLTAVVAFTLFAYGGSVYKPTDGGVAGASVLGARSTTNEIDFPYDADLVAVLDGTNVPKKSTDGTTWTQFGISAPTVAPTASAVAGGSLISGNTYQVSYSYRDDELGHEGNESATVSQAVSGGNLTVRVGVTASADPQVDKIFVYVRDVTSGEGQRRKYAEYANTTTTHDITSNTWFPNGLEAPTDHDVAPALEFALPWKNRWWGVIGRRLYFTQIFENQSWPALFYIDIPFEKGDRITAIISQGDTLVVFGAASKPYLIIGQTSLDFEVRPAFGAQAGALGFRSVAAIENGILHAAVEGMYIFDGASDRLLSDDIDGDGIGWQDCMQRAAIGDIERIALCYDTRRKFVHVSVPRLYPFGVAGEWVLDLHRTRVTGDPAWTSTDRTIGGYIQWDGAEASVGNRGRLFSWSNTTGRIYEECVGHTANGTDMVADGTGPTFATGGVNARFTSLNGEFQPSSGVFTVELFVDGRSQGSDTVDIGSALPKYGTFKYGTKKYGGGGDRLTFPIDMDLGAEGLTAFLKYRYQGQSEFKLYTYQIGYSPEALPRGIV